VPTIYTDRPSSSSPLSSAAAASSASNVASDAASAHPRLFSPHTVFTNQYAATEQSHAVGEAAVPGVFVKYDIEPILLTVAEQWGGLLGLLIRCVNVVAGVLVAGGWLVRLCDWMGEQGGRRGVGRGIGRRSRSGGGLLFGEGGDEKDREGL